MLLWTLGVLSRFSRVRLCDPMDSSRPGSSVSQVLDNISLCFSFAFPWWLAILYIFSCSGWSSAFPLWENVYSALLPIFLVGLFVFLILSYMILSYMFIYIGYKSLTTHIICWYFLLFNRLYFWYVNSFLCRTKLLSLIRSHLFLFVFAFRRYTWKNIVLCVIFKTKKIGKTYTEGCCYWQVN